MEAICMPSYQSSTVPLVLTTTCRSSVCQVPGETATVVVVLCPAMSFRKPSLPVLEMKTPPSEVPVGVRSFRR
jgi:hypothetical protein